MRWLTRKELKCSLLRDLGFLKIACIFLICVECNRRICSESADCLGSAIVVGTGGDTVLEVRGLLG